MSWVHWLRWEHPLTIGSNFPDVILDYIQEKGSWDATQFHYFLFLGGRYVMTNCFPFSCESEWTLLWVVFARVFYHNNMKRMLMTFYYCISTEIKNFIPYLSFLWFICENVFSSQHFSLPFPPSKFPHISVSTLIQTHDLFFHQLSLCPCMYLHMYIYFFQI